MLNRLIGCFGMLLVAGVPAPAALAANYVGSETCIECHESEFALWQESHHYQAMHRPTEQTVIGDFSGVGARFSSEGAAIREWYLFSGSLLLFVTYSCDQDNAGMDDAAVDELLDTLMVASGD